MNGKHILLSLKSTVKSRTEVGVQLCHPGDAVLIFREQPRWLVLNCPCGCGHELSLNLDSRAGAAWRLYFDRSEQLTIFPSVWLQSGCLSHFIVRKNRIEFLGDERRDVDFVSKEPEFFLLVSRVRLATQDKRWFYYVELAEALDEIPWDILDACRYLVHTGNLIDEQRGVDVYFRQR